MCLAPRLYPQCSANPLLYLATLSLPPVLRTHVFSLVSLDHNEFTFGSWLTSSSLVAPSLLPTLLKTHGPQVVSLNYNDSTVGSWLTPSFVVTSPPLSHELQTHVFLFVSLDHKEFTLGNLADLFDSVACPPPPFVLKNPARVSLFVSHDHPLCGFVLICFCICVGLEFICRHQKKIFKSIGVLCLVVQLELTPASSL
jgi:hypothetical protein